jgi:hypothetical protein
MRHTPSPTPSSSCRSSSRRGGHSSSRGGLVFVIRAMLLELLQLQLLPQQLQ